MSRPKKAKSPYPVESVEDSLGRPLAQVFTAVAAGNQPGRWNGPPLDQPVAHIALQPQDVIDRLADEDFEARVKRVVQLALQLGICQGYAIAKKEYAGRDEVYAAIQKALEAVGNRSAGK